MAGWRTHRQQERALSLPGYSGYSRGTRGTHGVPWPAGGPDTTGARPPSALLLAARLVCARRWWPQRPFPTGPFPLAKSIGSAPNPIPLAQSQLAQFPLVAQSSPPLPSGFSGSARGPGGAGCCSGSARDRSIPRGSSCCSQGCATSRQRAETPQTAQGQTRKGPAPRGVCRGAGTAPSRCHICTGTGLAPATSAPGLGSPLPHLRRDWAHRCHICTRTGLTAAASAPGPGSPLQPRLWRVFRTAAAYVRPWPCRIGLPDHTLLQRSPICCNVCASRTRPRSAPTTYAFAVVRQHRLARCRGLVSTQSVGIRLGCADVRVDRS